MAEMPKAYEPQAVETKWYSFWEENEWFTAKPERVSDDRPALPVRQPQRGRGGEFVAVESGVRSLDAEASRANQVCLERCTIRASPGPTGAR